MKTIGLDPATLLERELADRRGRLRSADHVMSPPVVGAARLTRYSFNRMMLRRASTDGWTVVRSRFDIDEHGAGEAVYEWHLDDQVYSFVAFTETLDESAHTDRVVADRWEITAVLVDGPVDAALLGSLRHEVPLQEGGRFDARVLTLTRGNRSVRFFDYLVETLASGAQPDPELVADAGYIMRSTAFYGNGKFGMRSFGGYDDTDPMGVPYRAQFAAAFLFRELSYDVVEHCAALRGGAGAVRFDDEWRRFFGLGNATGLGLVFYAFKHPRIMHAWASVREIALADVRALENDLALSTQLEWWIDRAQTHFATAGDDDCAPFASPSGIAARCGRVRAAWRELRTHPTPFDELWRWSNTQDPETEELVVSLLIELHDGDDAVVDQLLRVSESANPDLSMSASEAQALLNERFGWVSSTSTNRSQSADQMFWWVISDNTDEPRRVRRGALEPNGRDVTIDVAGRMQALAHALELAAPDETVGDVVARNPELLFAVHRLAVSDQRYGEFHDDACAAGYLPLQVQRFQLAFYGMDNFKPKSTDWLRVTLFQGAPRAEDLANGCNDDWVLPPRPTTRAGEPA